MGYTACSTSEVTSELSIPIIFTPGILGRDGLLRELQCGSRDPHCFHQNSTADLPIPWTPHLALC